MKKIIVLVLLVGCVSLSYADAIARARCLNTYTASVTKCGPQPPITRPLAYAKWAACMNAATAAYYACIARSYLPLAVYDDIYGEEN